MKKIVTIFVSLCASLLSYAAIEVPLYITDVNGVTDTLVIGVHPEATRGVDPQFGEEVITDGVAEFTGDHFALVQVESNRLGHKSIVPNAHHQFNAFTILVMEERFPIHVAWDPEPIAQQMPYSLITDLVVGCWFDCLYGYEKEATMADSSEIDFDFHLENHYLLSGTDIRLGAFYVSLTDYPLTSALISVEEQTAPVKTLVNGHLCIQVDGKTYNAQGILVK